MVGGTFHTICETDKDLLTINLKSSRTLECRDFFAMQVIMGYHGLLLKVVL